MTFKLETARLYLQDFSENDIASYVELYTEPSYCRFYSESDSDLEFQRQIAKTFIAKAALNPRQDYTLSIIEKTSNTFIGIISLRLEENKTASVGCGLSVASQGRGYAEEAMTKLLEYAFDDLGVERIIAETISENKAAVYLCEKFGFVRQDEIKQREFRNKVWTAVTYELSKN